MSQESAVTLFAPPRSDAPWWVVPILTFFLGVATTAAVMMPVVTTPDYRRGHDDGYKLGISETNVHRVWYEKGRDDEKTGAPEWHF